MTREQLKKLAGDEIFTAGLQFYQNNGVREMPRSPLTAADTQKQNGLQFVVNDNPRRTVAVRSDARAAVCSCDIYQQEYKEHGRRICPHVVAAILYYLASGKADEYFSRVALEAGDSLLSSYEPVIHETQLVLEPTLHVPAPRIGQSGSRLTGQDNSAAAPVTLSLRVGKRRSDMSGRLYAVRSVPKFLRGHMAAQEVEFSKSFTYQPQWMEFTRPQLPLLRLLCEIFTTIEPAERAGYKLVGDARLLPIPPLMMARLLRILSACPFKLAIGDKEFDIDSVKTDDLPLRAALDTVGRDIELTAHMESGRPVPLDLDGEFVFLSGDVYSLPPEKRQALFPLIKQMACGVNSFRFQPRQAERVISELLPQLKLAAPVTIGAGLKRRIVNEKLRPKVYLERQGAQSTAGGISARVKFCYGDLEIDPFAPAGTDAITQSQGIEDGFSFYDPDNPTEIIARPSDRAKSDSSDSLQTGERLLMRDAEGERQIIDVLSGYGFKVRLGEVHLTGQDEIYEFFVAGVKELSQVCEIYCSDAFRHMTPRKLTPHGRSYISDGKLLLSLGGDMGELPPQELVAILAALRDRKKYFRLHDGSMLSLEEIGEDWLELADAIADAGVVHRQGVLELESYRATYLDSLLHGLSGMETDSSVDDASHLEAPTDPCPDELNAILRPYQMRGFEWLQALYKLRLGGVLADDMGLGKTLQMIAVILYATLRDGHMPSLVVAPTTLTYNWLSEIRKFAPQLNVMVLDGSRQKRQEAIEHLHNASDMDVLITSYPLIRRDGELLSGFKFRFCILDEAQNIKNAQSVGAEAVRQIDALSRFALTGTPMENHPGELWSIFNFVMPGYLLGNAAFMRQHGQGQNAEQLRVKLRPFLLRRLKKDVLPELPDKVEQTIIADPTPEQQNVYKASLLRLRGHVQELMGQREDGTSAFGRNRIEVLSAITELRQICCHPSLCLDGYDGSSGKLELLMDILPTALENGHRVLLFSQFTSMLSIIRDRLTQEGIGWLYLDGQTPAEERISLVERFNSGMEKTPETADVPDVFLISLKAGGSGLNLVGADTVIHYDPWWNPAVEDQATDRVHRIGQTRSVQVLRLITRDTVEQGVLEMSQRKRALFDQVITAGDTIPTQLTEQEILALFQME